MKRLLLRHSVCQVKEGAPLNVACWRIIPAPYHHHLQHAQQHQTNLCLTLPIPTNDSTSQRGDSTPYVGSICALVSACAIGLVLRGLCVRPASSIHRVHWSARG